MCEVSTATPTSCDGLTVGFSAMSEHALEGVAAALSLTMRQGQLAACAAYYRSIGRDPTPCELSLLDACISSLERYHLADLTLQSLDTDDAALASALQAAVASLSKGRRSTPLLSLRRMLGTPDTRLPLFDPTTGERFAWMTEGDYATCAHKGGSPSQSLVIGDTDLRLVASVAAKPMSEGHLPSGCIVSLLTLPRRDETMYALFREWCRSNEVIRRLRHIQHLPRGTLLATLIALTGGCQIDLRVLCPDADRTHAEQLDEAEGILIVSPQSETHALLESARQRSFSARAFGRLTGSGTLSMSEGNTVYMALPLQFLHTFDRPRSIELHAHADGKPHTISTVSHTTDYRPADGWRRIVTHPSDTPVSFGAWTVLHTTIALDEALTHRDVTELLCRTVLRLVVAGADFASMFACAALSLHPDRSLTPAWSASLALRALAEAWHMPLANAIVTTAADQAPGTLTVCFVAPTFAYSASDGHRELRLFATPREEDGSIPLPTLGTLLRATGRAIKEGHASSPVAWIDRAVAAGLPVGTADEHATAAPDAALPQCGLLLHTDGQTPYGIRLGDIPVPADEPHENQASRPTQQALTVPTPLTYSAQHRPHPTVLMPVLTEMDRPTALLEHVSRLGGRAHVLSVGLTHEDCTALADAIEACDIVIFNGDAEQWNAMLHHRRIAHALATHLPDRLTLVLAKHAASLTFPEEWCPDEACRLRRLPDGITLGELSELVKYYQ